MEFKDYYATLGVSKTATDKEIKAAFRKLARKFHPDVNPGDAAAELQFKEINEAYEVLSDAAKRKKYDELGANWRMYEQAQQQGAGGGAPFNVRWTWSGAGAPGGFRTMTEEEVEEMFGRGDESPFSDFFRTFFGGGAAGPAGGRAGQRARATRVPRDRRGRDVEHALTLDLEDVLQGTVQKLSIQHGGQARTVDVRIPAGVTDGARVRVAGEGERGSGSGSSGDLYLRISVRPHPRFERRGRDLHTKVRVPLTTAVLGGEVDVPTLGGRQLRLKVPPATQAGQVFRLKGQGLPTVGRPDDRGDLYAQVDVALPAQLSAEERRHFEALRAIEARKQQEGRTAS